MNSNKKFQLVDVSLVGLMVYLVTKRVNVSVLRILLDNVATRVRKGITTSQLAKVRNIPSKYKFYLRSISWFC